ncbi:MAG: pentapeptide repeat-containing protein, partial [Cytophagales bacterium]|nr:pentapeptide repeat-containing protein [Cytophagales bacterium]
ETFPNILNTGGIVDSFVHRVRKGLPPELSPWRSRELRGGGSCKVFTSGVDQARKLEDVQWLHINPQIKRRVDAITYNKCRFGDCIPERVHYYKLLPDQFCQQYRDQLLYVSHETILDFLTFEEVRAICIPLALRQAMQSHISFYLQNFPDGRPLHQLMSAESLEEEFDRVTDIKSTPYRKPIVSLLKAAGCDQYARIKRINPELDKGLIYSLDGIIFKPGSQLQGLTLDRVSLADTVFTGIRFKECRLLNLNLTCCSIRQCHFINCSISNVTIDIDQLLHSQYLLKRPVKTWNKAVQNFYNTSNLPNNDKFWQLCCSGFLPFIQVQDEDFKRFLNEVNFVDLLQKIASDDDTVQQVIATALQENNWHLLSDHSLAAIDQFLRTDNGLVCFEDSQHYVLYCATHPNQLRHLLTINGGFDDGIFLHLKEVVFSPGSQIELIMNVKFFNNATLANVTISGSLKGTDFTGANLKGSRFDSCDLRDAIL